MALKIIRIIVIIFILAIAVVAILFVRKSQYPKRTAPATALAIAPQSSMAESAANYNDVIASLEAKRATLALRYQRAASATGQADIIAEARNLVTLSIYNEIFPSWYGTAWDFNGTTEVPRQGKIACGYFVTTVLRDAGWRLQRARLAQQASENIIMSLTTDSYVKRFRRVAIHDFVSAVEKWGAGIYVVGLDIHTGFIVNTGENVYFIHSSYVEPYAVVREKAIESKILEASKYRVLGKVTDDDLFIKKWLLRQEIATRTATS
jgi:hypothetical protein